MSALIMSSLLDCEQSAPSLVELGICVGSECIQLHGTRIATWRGTGPCSVYVAICDECYEQRLDADEREFMVELAGASRVRDIGLHELHLGEFPRRSS